MNSPFRQKWTKPLLLVVVCTVLSALVPTIGLAQLSPGKLANPHQHLEGLKKCGKCHKLGDKDLTPKCLNCHGEIKAMRTGKSGLHSGDDFEHCVDCHVDHQGRDYQMVHWPEGQENFNHLMTGFEKIGAHKKLNCRQCHKPELIVNPSRLEKMGKRLDRTFLGLESQCLSCHNDPHQNQFEAQCVSCHDQNAWKPASLFSHEKTSFQLTGLHGKLACDQCHVPAESSHEVSTIQFAGLPHQRCTDCHADPHKNSFGEDCTRCHDTTGWLNIRGEGFDHKLTQYPLQGRHAAVRCEECHSGDRKKPAFDRCDACHADAHKAGILKRPQLANCQECHTVQGFKPAGFTLVQHTATSFPLVGAHRAVPCLICHQEKTQSVKWTMQLAHDACTACHPDPHEGRMAAQDQGQGCIACHTQESFRTAVFDHGVTKFPLEGAHNRVTCAGCHGNDQKKINKTQCAECHEDPHRGQFRNRLVAGFELIDCAGCHVTTDWLAERFDHETDSRFPLRGGHRHVACGVCHQPQDQDKPRLLLYKPLSMECISCHQDNPDIEKGSE